MLKQTPGVSYFEPGIRLTLPSGQTGYFICWRGRAVQRGDASQGIERIAVVQIDGVDGPTEFSDRFMGRVRTCQQ